jgi:protein Tex
MTSSPLAARVARELSLSPHQVEGALTLFRNGATLPFIARYRKEATGGLDEVQLREVRDRAAYLDELEARRAAILASVGEQGELTSELERAIRRAETKQELEDLYLPYRPRRRTRGTMARERGLEPLADLVWGGRADDRAVREATRGFVDASREVPDAETALQGARDILAERVAEDAGLRRRVRDLIRRNGVVASRAARGKKDAPEAARFRDYFDHSEPVRRIPSHRMLAIRRGESEGVLKWEIEGPEEEILAEVERVALGRRAARAVLREVADDAARRVLTPSVASEVAGELKERAETEAIRVFGENLEQLLLQPPAGERAVLGLDPGFRTGVKAAMVSPTGAVLATDTLYLHEPGRFAAGIRALVERHRPELIAVGNGTASRETEKAVREALEGGGNGSASSHPTPAVVLVNEAGASVYSASELAREELPGDGRVAPGSRLHRPTPPGPLAELVKIDPRSIGVGQYQHDVHQPSLRRRLDETVELCVNRVGVELNTASAPLLGYVSGIGPALARAIVERRDRRRHLPVPEGAPAGAPAGTEGLRAGRRVPPDPGGRAPPGRHRRPPGAVRAGGADGPGPGALGGGAGGDDEAVRQLEGKLERYVSGDVGLPTLEDIVEELRRPGRDPREAFEAPAFREDVREPADLKPGCVSRAWSRTWWPSARSWTWACTRTAWSTSPSSRTGS